MQGLDQRIVLFFQSVRCESLTALFKVFIPLEFWNVVAVVLVLFFFLRTRILRVPIVSFVLAKSLSAFFYETLKYLVARPRPYLMVKGLTPLITPHGFSFPSGHATLAMAMAVVLAHHFPKFRVTGFLLAILVGISRVYFGVHYLSDVLAGFVLGAFLGYLSLLLEQTVISGTKGVEFSKKS